VSDKSARCSSASTKSGVKNGTRCGRFRRRWPFDFAVLMDDGSQSGLLPLDD